MCVGCHDPTRPNPTQTHNQQPTKQQHNTTKNHNNRNNDNNFNSNDEYVAPAKAKAISRLATALCLELRSVALPLVAAWAIPDHVLRAPIGLGLHSGADVYREYLAAAGFE